MARTTPLVRGGTLVTGVAVSKPIQVGTLSWYAWLKQATSFAFCDANGRFTARKEERGRDDGYWRAYRRQSGKLYSLYLGRSANLTLEQLQQVSQGFGHLTAGAAALAAAPADLVEIQMTKHVGRSKVKRKDSLSGTVTYLFVDAENDEIASTLLKDALKKITQAERGVSVDAAPSVAGGAFASPLDGLAAALKLCGAVAKTQSIRPRIALHTGVVIEDAYGCQSPTARWCLRLLAAGHNGQVLLSHVTQALLQPHLMNQITACDLGAFSLDESSLAEHLYQLIAPDLPAKFPPLQSPARRPHNLLLPPTPLIGREQDVEDVVAALQGGEVRLLILNGPGGVGKTRLALQAAVELRNTFADGVFFVEMATGGEPGQEPGVIYSSIAQVLELADDQAESLPSRLQHYLSSKEMLLVLDNFEQVLAGASHLIPLLHAAPRLKLLITSRALLHIVGEYVYQVKPLALPDLGSLPEIDQLAGIAAIALFVQRARAVDPLFVFTTEVAPAIVEICRRLDGLPLALELAAAHSRLLPPVLLLERLSHPLPLLTGGARNLPLRQRTLRDTLDWSYRLLNVESQRLLRRLAVFAGGFKLEAAEEVCATIRDSSAFLSPSGNILAPLNNLVEHSLLRVASNGRERRFYMLETVREYAQEKLNECDEASLLARRHMTYFLNLVETAETALNSLDMRPALDQVDADIANIRMALTEMLAAGKIEQAGRMTSALLLYWDVRSHRSEGSHWLEDVLAHKHRLPAPLRAKVLYASGYLARAQNNFTAAFAFLAESLELYHTLQDESAYTQVSTYMGWTMASLGVNVQRAKLLLEEGLVRYRAANDKRGLAWALQGLGWLEKQRALGYANGIANVLAGYSAYERRRGSLGRARALLNESMALRIEIGDMHGLAWSLSGLGTLAAAEGKYGEARAHQEKRLAIEKSLDNAHGVIAATQQLGMIALRQGDTDAAHTWMIGCLSVARDISDQTIWAFVLLGLGELARITNDYRRARVYLDEASERFFALGDHYRCARIAAMLAQITLEEGNLEQAQDLARQCLRTAHSLTDRVLTGFCLASMGDGAAKRGKAAWAARLWAAAENQLNHPTVRRTLIKPPERPQLIAQVRRQLGADIDASVWSAGQSLMPEEALIPPESKPAGTEAAPCPVQLTTREMEVLLLVAGGLSNAQIANRLVITLNTVKSYLSSVYKKLGVSSRTAAMKYVIEQGLPSHPMRV